MGNESDVSVTPSQTIHRAYVYVLDPTPTQVSQFESHCGGARFAYNHMLGLVKSTLEQRDAERTYDIPDDQLTPSMSWSQISLNNAFNARKDVAAPWNRENSSRVYLYAMESLATALKNWADSRKGKRKGRGTGFPTFHNKRSRKSCTFPGANIKMSETRHRISFPVIGSVHTIESTRKLSRLVEQSKATIKRATLSYHRGRWQVALLAEVAAPVRKRKTTPTVVGIDVGVKDWLVAGTADGSEVLRVGVPDKIKELDTRRRVLQRRNRNRQAPRKGVAPSKRWLDAQRKIAKLDWKMAAIREDALHKATTELTKRFDVIVIENLNVKGMMAKGGSRKRGLNRSIARAGMATTHHMLTYKGLELIEAGRLFPSSKTCSSCGTVKTKLGLDERTYICDHNSCGHTMDRDLNAAVNLAKYGEDMISKAGSPSASGRGAERKTGDALRGPSSAAGSETSTPFGESETGNGLTPACIVVDSALSCV
jgi:putative transposase